MKESTMGSLYHFKSLKDFANKLVKFKQERLLIEALAQGLVADDHIKYVIRMDGSGRPTGGGACAGFVMDWLLNQKTNGTTLYLRSRGDTHHPQHLENVRAVVPSYVEYAKRIECCADYPWALKKLAADYEFQQFEYMYRGTSVDEMRDQLQNPDQYLDKAKTQGYYIAVEFDPVGNHAVGAWRENGVIYFFDPNVGEYEITDIEGFFRAYAKIYEDAFKLSFKCYTTYKVGK
jgi:hypothetical protein